MLRRIGAALTDAEIAPAAEVKPVPIVPGYSERDVRNALFLANRVLMERPAASDAFDFMVSYIPSPVSYPYARLNRAGDTKTLDALISRARHHLRTFSTIAQITVQCQHTEGTACSCSTELDMEATNIVRGNLAQLLSLNVLIPDLREVTIHNISMHVQVTGTEVPLGLTMYSVTPDDALDLPLIPGRVISYEEDNHEAPKIDFAYNMKSRYKINSYRLPRKHVFWHIIFHEAYHKDFETVMYFGPYSVTALPTTDAVYERPVQLTGEAYAKLMTIISDTTRLMPFVDVSNGFRLVLLPAAIADEDEGKTDGAKGTVEVVAVIRMVVPGVRLHPAFEEKLRLATEATAAMPSASTSMPPVPLYTPSVPYSGSSSGPYASLASAFPSMPMSMGAGGGGGGGGGGTELLLTFTANVLDSLGSKEIKLRIINGEQWLSIMNRAYEQRVIDFERMRCSRESMLVRVLPGKTEMDWRTIYMPSHGTNFELMFNGGRRG